MGTSILNDRRRVELGIPIDMIERNMMHLREFCESPPGVLVNGLLIKASSDVIAGLNGTRTQHKHRARVQRETDAITMLLYAGPAEARPNKMEAFYASVALFNKIVKLGKLPIRGRVGYMQLSTFVENLVEPKSGDLTLLGEQINEGRITAMAHAMLGVAMSRGYYVY